MTPDIHHAPYGERSGIDIYAVRDGIVIQPWYDTNVAIETLFIPFKQIEALRAAAKRRIPWEAMMQVNEA